MALNSAAGVMHWLDVTVVGIAVSLVTSPVSSERLDRFYLLSRTPVAEDEQIVEPCVLPASTPPSQRKMLLTAAGLEISRPSRTSLVGFVMVWLCVAGMIGMFVWLISH